METAQDGYLREIQQDSEGNCQCERAKHDGYWKGLHRDAANSQYRGDQKIDDGRSDEPGTGTGGPQSPTFAIGIGRRLVAENNDDKGQRSQGIDAVSEAVKAKSEHRDAENQFADPHGDPRYCQIPDAPCTRAG